MRTEKRARRTFEPSVEDLENFVGEDSLLFELIQTRLAECYAVDGPDEEACIHDIAKCLLLKRHLPTLRTELKAQIDEEASALHAFSDLLLPHEFEKDREARKVRESKIRYELNGLLGKAGAHLRRKIPRQAHASAEAWVEALYEEIANVLQPRVIYASLEVEQKLQAPSGKLADKLLTHQLFYEKQLDDSVDRSLKRLFRIKEAKRQITFRDLQRFDRTHPNRLSGVVE